MASDAVVILCTFGNPDAAAAAAHNLVTNGLAACVNVLPEVRSFYRWKGGISDSGECLTIIKTTAARFEDVRARLIELHEYEVPEVIALPVVAGHAPYLAWIAENASGEPPPSDD